MASPGHKRTERLIEAEAYRRIVAGDVPATLDKFAREISDWLSRAYPGAEPLSPETIEERIRATWHERHEIVQGGGL
jgi:hypothetical protein